MPQCLPLQLSDMITFSEAASLERILTRWCHRNYSAIRCSCLALRLGHQIGDFKRHRLRAVLHSFPWRNGTGWPKTEATVLIACVF